MDEIRYRDAVGRVRFGISPLAEVGLSLIILRRPDWHPYHARWYEATAAARERIGIDRLLALVGENRWVADFCFIRPAGVEPTFDGMLGQLAALPRTRFVADLERVHGSLPAVLGTDDAEVKASVIDTLDAYWRGCHASTWPSTRRVLQADVAYRGRRLAYDGLAVTLGEINPRFIVQGRDLVIPLRHDKGFDVDVSGDGVLLMPTLVKYNPNFPNSTDLPVALSYRARGRGVLSGPAEAPHLVPVLGRVRTDLLAALEEPASSTALALYLGVTTTAVNQHLRALRDAGLLDSHRLGRYVLYERSELGSRLLGAAAARTRRGQQ